MIGSQTMQTSALELMLNSTYRKLDEVNTEIANSASFDKMQDQKLSAKYYRQKSFMLGQNLQEKKRLKLEASFIEHLLEKRNQLDKRVLSYEDWKTLLEKMALVNLEEIDPSLKMYLLDVSAAWNSGKMIISFPKFLEKYFSYSNILKPRDPFGVFEKMQYEGAFEEKRPAKILSRIPAPDRLSIEKMQKSETEKIKESSGVQVEDLGGLEIELIPNGK
ncbi:MAG: hypothetical protein VX642_00415 [Bdellovibrionota bacterium]|nr:hypothetical protein [Bdellovibrionota bacterium]